jgi:hypothetical protein
MISQTATAKKKCEVESVNAAKSFALATTATPGNPDDCDVLDGERAIGRIFRTSNVPQGENGLEKAF